MSESKRGKINRSHVQQKDNNRTACGTRQINPSHGKTTYEGTSWNLVQNMKWNLYLVRIQIKPWPELGTFVRNMHRECSYQDHGAFYTIAELARTDLPKRNCLAACWELFPAIASKSGTFRSRNPAEPFGTAKPHPPAHRRKLKLRRMRLLRAPEPSWTVVTVWNLCAGI